MLNFSGMAEVFVILSRSRLASVTPEQRTRKTEGWRSVTM